MEQVDDAQAVAHPTKTASLDTSRDDDPNIVNWDGPEDPENPRNWKSSFKLVNVLLIGLSVLCTYVEHTPLLVCET